MRRLALVLLVPLAAHMGLAPDDAPPPATVAFSDLVIETSAVDFGQVPECGWCKYCLGGHDMNADGDYYWHDCLNIPCMSHPECGVGEEDADDLQAQETMAALITALSPGQ